MLVSSVARNPVFLATPSFKEFAPFSNSIKENEAKEALAIMAKRPIKISDLKERSKIPDNIIKNLVESKFLDWIKDEQEEWVMCHNNSLSLEHEFYVSKIAKLLNDNKIANRIVDNSTGPDIIAIVDNKKIALEYETGSKSQESTIKMMNSRINEYYKTIVVTKKELVNNYRNICNNPKLEVMGSDEYDELVKSIMSG